MEHLPQCTIDSPHMCMPSQFPDRACYPALRHEQRCNGMPGSKQYLVCSTGADNTAAYRDQFATSRSKGSLVGHMSAIPEYLRRFFSDALAVVIPASGCAAPELACRRSRDADRAHCTCKPIPYPAYTYLEEQRRV